MPRRMLFSLLVAAALGACTPAEDWTSPEYIQHRIELNDPRAFNEFAHLSPEAQSALVPTLVDVYNSGLRQDESLRALVLAADPRAKEVFLSALERADDRSAGLAARGLARLGDADAAAAVAQRLTAVTQHDAYPAFLEALEAIPSAQAADVVAGVMMRPVERIGGIGTVRQGCTILGKIENPSDDVLTALTFGLVNFVPQPFQDALNECELAILAHGDAAVPKLAEMFRGENSAINARLTSMRYDQVVGPLRAGAVLSHIASPAAMAPILAWLRTPRTLPVAELERMTPDQASQWYDFNGQLFGAVTRGLAYTRTDETIAALRGLESVEGEGSLLANFRPWFQLSAGAEFGLRTGVHEALMKVGTEADRELLWTRAASGTVPTGRGEYFNTELRKNATHFVGRTARPGETDRFVAVMNAQPRPVEFVMHLGYFVLADLCGEDVSCFAGALTDTGPVTGHDVVNQALEPLDEATRAAAINGMGQNIRTGAIWQLALRLGDQPAAGDALLSALTSSSMQVRFEAAEALRFTRALPTDSATRIAQFLEAEAGSTAPQARELRHAVRVFRAMRL